MGLTADGTLWTMGTDLTQDAQVPSPAREKMSLWHWQPRDFVGPKNESFAVKFSYYPPNLKEPSPLMKLGWHAEAR